MIKVMFTWRDRKNISPEEVERHYREVHTKLALADVEQRPGYLAYVQNRVIACRTHNFNAPVSEPAQPAFDRCVELYFTDRDAMRGTVDPDRLARIFKDHENFMLTDVPNSLMVHEVEERIPFRRDAWAR